MRSICTYKKNINQNFSYLVQRICYKYFSSRIGIVIVINIIFIRSTELRSMPISLSLLEEQGYVS